MWNEIPIFFNNRNRLSSLTTMIEWLMNSGSYKIYILDNDSTYPPLLEYYQKMEGLINVIKLNANLGPWAFWQLGLHEKINSNYIVSDSDLVPTVECPRNLIQEMLRVLEKYPHAKKVAPGLKIDDLPDHYKKKNLVYEWESQFWHKPISDKLYLAPTDTTFSMYSRGSNFVRDTQNIRIGFPYLLRHEPWYINEDQLSEEEQYYRDNSNPNFSYWVNDQKDGALIHGLENYKLKNKFILNLNCKDNYIPGWINIGAHGVQADIFFDLNNCKDNCLPIANDSVDGFYLSLGMQVITEPHTLLKELHRIGKNNSKLFIRIAGDLLNNSSNINEGDISSIRDTLYKFRKILVENATSINKISWAIDSINLITNDNSIQSINLNPKDILLNNNVSTPEIFAELRVIKIQNEEFSHNIDVLPPIYSNCEFGYPNF